MTSREARKQRREAERQARKIEYRRELEARRAEINNPGMNRPEINCTDINFTEINPAEMNHPEIHPAESNLPEIDRPEAKSPAINRANAQFSTGPRTAQGKAKSALNAVKTGLTGRTVLLPTDDAAAYEKHVQRFMKDLKPVGPREYELVQALADNSWRCERVFSLEMAIFAKGRTQFAAQFEREDAASRTGLIELETFLHYEKQIRNLHIQEGRLRRQRQQDLAELEKLQKERIQKEKQELDIAAKLYLAAKHDKKPFDPAEFGFDFSIDAIESYLNGVRAAQIARQAIQGSAKAA